VSGAKAASPRRKARYQVQVRNVGWGGTWAGRPLGSVWVPALDGTLNGTGASAADASTFDLPEQAAAALDIAREEIRDGDTDEDEDGHAGYEFRVIEVLP